MCMKYRLRGNFSKEPTKALEEILTDRGVRNIREFCMPSFLCERNPYNLDNIQEGVDMLLKHLKARHKILLIVD